FAHFITSGFKGSPTDRIERNDDKSYFSTISSPALINILKAVGPLFEAFMEKAVADRLENSEAKVLITNKALLPRVPVDKLPN
ncbi:hypothetical protein QT22_00080, partial [Staphylococcus aureus]